MQLKTTFAFTITELLVVAILLALMIGFAVPNFTKTKVKAFERDARAQLQILHEANQLYYSKEGAFLATNTDIDVDTWSYLNTNLNISLAANDSSITYQRPGADQYTAVITFQDIALQVTQDEDSVCCSTGACTLTPQCH